MKWLMIGDLHFGEKNNSEKFNKSVLSFFDWVNNTFAGKVDKCVQFGDWFHNRNKIDVSTLCFGIEAASRLGETFGKENVYALVSNHDIYYRDRLDVSSMEAIKPYINVVDSITEIENILFVPWITDGEMWDSLVNNDYGCKVMFGHLELSGFKLNDGYIMEHGYSPKELRKFNRVFSGHYHSHQVNGNITYLGTPYPITMNEANEHHGVFVYDDETDTIEFTPYEAIKVVSIPYTEIETIDSYDVENTTIRIEFPDDLDDETIITDVTNYLKEKGFEDYKIKYTGKKLKQILESESEEVSEVENIDEVVMNHLKKCTDVSGIDKERLVKFYQMAKDKETE